jgi:phosphoesterase RecJ-like protein
MGGKKNISVDAAEALYLGIMTDTGSFSYSVRTPATFRIIADLMELGADKECIASRVFNGYSEERLRLLGYSLKDKLKIIHQKNVAYIALSQEELKSYNFQSGDTEGFVNYPLSIQNVCVSALFTESMDKSIIRISFRSKGKDISVNDFSRKYFNGGGHFNAAGGKYFKSLEECCAYFEQVVMEQDW